MSTASVYGRSLMTASATTIVDVTPDNDNDLPDGVCRAVRVNGAGTVTLVTVDDTTVTLTFANAGEMLPVFAKRIKATGTLATGIQAWY